MRFGLLLSLVLPGLATAATPRASSEYRADDGERYTAAQAFDGRLSTAWVPAEERTEDDGGAWVELRLDRTTEITSVSVWPGELSRGTRSLREWGRPRTITVTLTGGAEDVSVTRRIPDPAPDRAVRVDVPIAGTARTVRVTIDDAYEGAVTRRTAIAEVAVNHIGDAEPPGADRVAAWLDSDAGQRAASRDAAELEIIVGLLDGGEDEEAFEQAREALAALKERASEGAPYVRARVERDVPMGFWTRAIPPQMAAVEALVEAEDPGVVPALELAALRSLGAEERRLWGVVERYQAWGELRGGQRMNVPAWGRAGWSRGELQTFGEPLEIAVDQFGRVYAADIANNRIQRFNERGVVDEVWGADEPGLDNSWLGGPRRWYPAGSAPGDGPGTFTNPLDIVMLPGKAGDGFAVIDGTKRVQIFDAAGTFQRSWSVDASDRLIPGLGGQAYILHSRGRIVVLWGEEGFVFKQDGTEIARFTLEDGAPSGAVVLKNGKLGLIYQQELVMVSLDGFRHGTILADAFEIGFESWDITMDEERRLWAVTDTGWLYKLKKPGRIEWALRISEQPIQLPRIAAFDGRAYISSNNRIRVVDALQLLAEEEAESADAAP